MDLKRIAFLALVLCLVSSTSHAESHEAKDLLSSALYYASIEGNASKAHEELERVVRENRGSAWASEADRLLNGALQVAGDPARLARRSSTEGDIEIDPAGASVAVWREGSGNRKALSQVGQGFDRDPMTALGIAIPPDASALKIAISIHLPRPTRINRVWYQHSLLAAEASEEVAIRILGPGNSSFEVSDNTVFQPKQVSEIQIVHSLSLTRSSELSKVLLRDVAIFDEAIAPPEENAVPAPAIADNFFPLPSDAPAGAELPLAEAPSTAPQEEPATVIAIPLESNSPPASEPSVVDETTTDSETTDEPISPSEPVEAAFSFDPSMGESVVIGSLATLSLSSDANADVRIDDGDWTSYEAPFALEGLSRGEHKISYRISEGGEGESIVRIVDALSLTKTATRPARVLLYFGRSVRSETPAWEAALQSEKSVYTEAEVLQILRADEADLVVLIGNAELGNRAAREIVERVYLGRTRVLGIGSRIEDLSLPKRDEGDEGHSSLFGSSHRGRVSTSEDVEFEASTGERATPNVDGDRNLSYDTLRIEEEGDTWVRSGSEVSGSTRRYGAGEARYLGISIEHLSPASILPLLNNHLNYEASLSPVAGGVTPLSLSVRPQVGSSYGLSFEVLEEVTGATIEEADSGVISDGRMLRWSTTLPVGEEARLGYSLRLDDEPNEAVSTTTTWYLARSNYRSGPSAEIRLTPRRVEASEIDDLLASLKEDAERTNDRSGEANVDQAIRDFERAQRETNTEDKIEKILDAIDDLLKTDLSIESAREALGVHLLQVSTEAGR